MYRPAPAADGGTCWCIDVVAIRECVRPIPGCARKRGASQQLGSSRKSRLRGRVVGSPGQNRTSRLLKDELLFQRATQVYLWARPLVNALGMKARSEKGLGFEAAVGGCSYLVYPDRHWLNRIADGTPSIPAEAPAPASVLTCHRAESCRGAFDARVCSRLRW